MMRSAGPGPSLFTVTSDFIDLSFLYYPLHSAVYSIGYQIGYQGIVFRFPKLGGKFVFFMAFLLVMGPTKPHVQSVSRDLSVFLRSKADGA
jgi:hypothetical protein